MTEDIKTEEEEKAYREELAAQIWEGKEPEDPEPPAEEEEPKEEEVKAQEPEPEPEPPAESELKQTLENINYRLKQTESRLGAMQNEFYAAKKSAEDVKNAPTQEQIEASSESEEEWEELKENFPEWASAIDNRLAADRSSLESKIPEIEVKFKKSLDDIKSELSATIEQRILYGVHRDWEEIIQKDDYKTWLAAQPKELQDLTGSPYASDAIYVLDKYKDFKRNPKKTPAEIAADRKERLKQSKETGKSYKEQPPKSEADMSEAELRAKIANEVWSD